MTNEEGNGLTRILSHGRGGAGNIGESDPKAEGEDIKTIPTIKSPVYTTGRGGQGNMALNDPAHPEYARQAQDLAINPPRPSGDIHGGRGGAGNVLNPAVEEEIIKMEAKDKKKMKKGQIVETTKGVDYRGWADKGKDLLFGRKKKTEA
ncbi:hypothetical protein BJ508DRAFT_417689 [Ascobolus immersus RN42]|uniref:Uncharacterized protein n=1 Tax=Ascobolus immersus RN42 TaxID=1160509 RepID=A0A3N4HSH8_ASCIM|nr:hypothetical protein BJ508DRAFT_417689 [Ascobolus immersus RN42]